MWTLGLKGLTSFGDCTHPQYQETTSSSILFDPECRIDPSNHLSSKCIFSIPFLRVFLITLIRKISFPALFRRTIKRNKIDANIRAQKEKMQSKFPRPLSMIKTRGNHVKPLPGEGKFTTRIHSFTVFF